MNFTKVSIATLYKKSPHQKILQMLLMMKFSGYHFKYNQWHIVTLDNIKSRYKPALFKILQNHSDSICNIQFSNKGNTLIIFLLVF